MKEYQGLVSTPHISGQVVSIKISPLACLTTFISGLLSSAIALMKPRSYSLTTGSGLDEPRESESCLQRML